MALTVPNFYLLTLTKEVLHCYETSVRIYQSAHLDSTEDLNLHLNFCKNLNYRIFRDIWTMSVYQAGFEMYLYCLKLNMRFAK